MVDTSVKAWILETKPKNLTVETRSGSFLGLGKKRERTVNDLHVFDRIQYNRWKKKKEDAEKQKVEDEKRATQEKLNQTLTTIVTKPSARELANKALLASIKRIEAVELSKDTSEYIGDNEIEKKYPKLVESIFNEVSSHGDTLRADEEYAQVVVTDTINSTEEVLEHIRWMITKPTNPSDVELRNVEEMGSWVLQTTEDVGLGAGSGGSDLGVKPTEQPKPPIQKSVLPQLRIPIGEIKKDAVVIGRSKLIPFDVSLLNQAQRQTVFEAGNSYNNLNNNR